MTALFTFRQGTENDFRALLDQQHDITERLFDAQDDEEREELVFDQQVAFKRTGSVRSYEVQRDGTNEFSVRERNQSNGFGWGLVSGESLEELEAKLEAALAAVRNAKTQNEAQPLDIGSVAQGKTFVIPA